jgi:hypothetical protein
VLATTADDVSRLRDPDRRPQKTREPDEEPEPGEGIPERESSTHGV